MRVEFALILPRSPGTGLDSPLTTTYPSSEFWGIDQSIRYGASTTILTTTAGVVDTGTTFILIATGKWPRRTPLPHMHIPGR